MRYIDSFVFYRALLSRERELNKALRDISIENSKYLLLAERLKEVQHIRDILVLVSSAGNDKGLQV